MNEEEKQKLLIPARLVFSPNAPIDKYALFAGRTEQVSAVIGAFVQRGQHVVMYGERGVGKTSLANVLSEVILKAELRNTVYAKVNCDSTDDFSTLWRKIFREIHVTEKMREMGFVGQETPVQSTLDKFVPEKLAPDDIRHVLKHLESSIIIIDEIDRIEDQHLTSLLADTIKTALMYLKHNASFFAPALFPFLFEFRDLALGNLENVTRDAFKVFEFVGLFFHA